MLRFVRFFLILLLPLPAPSGQDTPPPQQAPQLQPRPAEPEKAPPPGVERRIALNVQVTDKSGSPVRGLQQQDFTVLDDKRPQPTRSFQAVDGRAATASDPPIQILLVVDAVNGSFHTVAYERSELKK